MVSTSNKDQTDNSSSVDTQLPPPRWDLYRQDLGASLVRSSWKWPYCISHHQLSKGCPCFSFPKGTGPTGKPQDQFQDRGLPQRPSPGNLMQAQVVPQQLSRHMLSTWPDGLSGSTNLFSFFFFSEKTLWF